jgi:hypothetical protein
LTAAAGAGCACAGCWLSSSCCSTLSLQQVPVYTRQQQECQLQCCLDAEAWWQR